MPSSAEDGFFYPFYLLCVLFYKQFKKTMSVKRYYLLNIPQHRFHPFPHYNSPYDRVICRINTRCEMMNDREKAIEKVRKLMSLAENAGNENEAANAFSKARVFMKKYRLELSDIYSADPSPPPSAPPSPPRRKTPPRPLTPEEQHREMMRLKQQEEERLRAFQKVAEQQQQRKQQREREQQALRAFERQQAELRAQQQAAQTPPPVTPPQEPVPQPDKQPPPQPENHISEQPREPAEPVSRPLIAGFLAALTRKQHIPSYIIAVIIIVFILYIFFFQS